MHSGKTGLAASQVETLTKLVRTVHNGRESVWVLYKMLILFYKRRLSVCDLYAFSSVGASLGITSDGFFQLEELPG